MNLSEQRIALIAAGQRLAARLELAQVSPEAISREAGLEPNSLTALFVDMENYLIALQQEFMDNLRLQVVQATAEHPLGGARLRLGAIAYLDGCLAQRSVRGWFIEARRQTRAVAQGLANQNQAYLLVISTEFRALRWPHPLAASRLFLTAVLEIARLEHGGGQPQAPARAALWDFLLSYEKKAA